MGDIISDDFNSEIDHMDMDFKYDMTGSTICHCNTPKYGVIAGKV